ncbi:MAG: hypothetical protein KIS92_12800 [Planctomycetota bacterium]|nr:hypothetical protein [Planctomycetota bacterium]
MGTLSGLPSTSATAARPEAKRLSTPTFQFRVRVLCMVFALGFGVVAARLFQLQIVNCDFYRDQARSGGGVQRLDSAPRGTIGDRVGTPLARDLPSFDLAVRADRLPLETLSYKDVVAAREQILRRAAEEKRAPTTEEYRAVEQAYEGFRAKLLREPWIVRLAATVKTDEAAVAGGVMDAFDRVARRWAMASAPSTILRGVDEALWTRLRAMQESGFRSDKKDGPALLSTALPGTASAPPADFPGLVCVHSVRRAYLHGASAAHVLGTLGELQPEQLACLREHGVLIDHLDEREALWAAHRAKLSDPQAAALAELLGADPRGLRDLGELFAALERLDGARRRRAADLGLVNEVRWLERPPRMELCEPERIALGVGDYGGDRRVRGSLVDLRIGQTGVEAWYNDLLRCRHGFESFGGQDASRLPAEARAREGQMLALTISSAWQQACERALAAQAKPAAMVVLDCRTGEVLAMASYPAFDPNLFSPPRDGKERQEALRALLQDPAKPLTNRCIGEQYPLGSVMKVLVAAVAVEKGLVRPEETFYCEGALREGRTLFRCDSNIRHGRVNIVEALRRSCNVCFYQVGARIGVEGLAPWAKAAGLGRRTSIDLPGEASGIYPDRAWRERHFGNSPWDLAWTRGKDYHLAIGQGYMAVTPLQAACMMAAIANGGYAVTPRLWLDAPAEAPRPMGFSARTIQIVREGLDEVANCGTPGAHGTAYRAFHSGEALAVRAAGKTGTADTGHANESPHAWFVGYAPSEAPRVAFAVLVENGGHGGEVAAPIARNVLKEIYGTRSAPVRDPGASAPAP